MLREYINSIVYDEDNYELEQEIVRKYPVLRASRSYWIYDIPRGWLINFGEDLVRDLNEAVSKYNSLIEFNILEVKEKFGGLRIYIGAMNCNIFFNAVNEVIEKYEQLSFVVCVGCGNPATKISKTWIVPVCEKCEP